MWGIGREVFTTLDAESGSSFSRETFREAEMPAGEEDRDLWDEERVEDAREASSRESLGACVDGILRLA